MLGLQFSMQASGSTQTLTTSYADLANFFNGFKQFNFMHNIPFTVRNIGGLCASAKLSNSKRTIRYSASSCPIPMTVGRCLFSAYEDEVEHFHSFKFSETHFSAIRRLRGIFVSGFVYLDML